VAQVAVAMARNRHFARLRRVLELAMASSLSREPPAVAFDQLDHLAHLHTLYSDARV
jgi:hypothetical protein